MVVRLSLLCVCVFGPRSSAGGAACPLSTVSLEGDDTWTGLTSPEPLSEDAVNCSWYAGSTCCTAADTLRISHDEPEISLRGSTRGCRDVLHLLMCSPCSPRQDTIFLSEKIGEFTVPVLQVCESLCDQMYSRCASALYSQDGGRVDRTFTGGEERCAAAGLRVVRAVDHAVCFSAAPPRRRLETPSAVLVALVTSVALLQGVMIQRNVRT